VFDADMGYKVMTAIDLGVKSYRQGKVMAFDPKRELVLDEPGARPAYEGSGKNYDER
jgi:hypothetical protein